MIAEREQARIEAFKQETVSLKGSYKRKQSLALRISINFLLLTVINLIIFWAVTGTNQINLIMKNAEFKSLETGRALIDYLKPVIADSQWANKLDDVKTAPEAEKALVESLKKAMEKDASGQAMLTEFWVINTKSAKEKKVIFSSNKNSKKTVLSAEEFQNVLKSVQMRELQGKRFFPKPEIFDLKNIFYVPLTERGVEDYVLIVETEMAYVWEGLKTIFIFAIAMVGILLVLQVGFGFLLYHFLIKPIKNLSSASQKIAEGDLEVQVGERKQSDELGMLVYMFNKMTAALKEKTAKLTGTILELEKHNEIMMNELDMAQTIQQSIMPTKSISSKIATSIYYSPLEKVSGDYYDMFEFQDGSLGIIIMDASGHGVPAALVTMMAKVHVSRIAQELQDPGKMLTEANKELARAIVTSDYLTAFYLILRPDLTMEYCNASHQLTLIVRKSGEVETLDTGGFFIGAIEDSPFEWETGKTQLQIGDRIILYTDGIVEGTNRERTEYSLERLISRVKEYATLSLDELNQKIISDVDAFAEGEPRKDDYSLFAIEILAAGDSVRKQPEIQVVSHQNQAALEDPKVDEMQSNQEAGQVGAANLDTLKEGMESYSRHDFESAKRFFKKVLENEPGNTNASLYYANSMFYLKEYDSALPIFENYLKGQVENPYAHLKLGVCYAKQNREQLAIEQYQKAILLNANLAEAYGQLGISLANRGDHAEARRNIEKALAIKPDDQRLIKLKQKLDARTGA